MRIMENNKDLKKKNSTNSDNNDARICLIIGDICINLKDSISNRKILSILGINAKSAKTGEKILTLQEVARQLGYPDRRNIHLFHEEFESKDSDFRRYLMNLPTKKRLLRIEKSLSRIQDQLNLINEELGQESSKY